jgi:hypothetical protein
VLLNKSNKPAQVLGMSVKKAEILWVWAMADLTVPMHSRI